MLAWHSCHSRLFRLLPLTMQSSAFKAPDVVSLKILRFISAFSPDSMAVSVFSFQTGFVHISKTLELQDSYFEALKVLEMLFLFIESP